MSDGQSLPEYFEDLLGPDPFDWCYRESNAHRNAHGDDCEVFPSSPASMRLVSVLLQSTRAARVLEIGCGLGYSALWLAEAGPHVETVDTIDRDDAHAAMATRNIERAGLSGKVRVHVGEADKVLATLIGRYDFVYDDGWFMAEPAIWRE